MVSRPAALDEEAGSEATGAEYPAGVDLDGTAGVVSAPRADEAP